MIVQPTIISMLILPQGFIKSLITSQV